MQKLQKLSLLLPKVACIHDIETTQKLKLVKTLNVRLKLHNHFFIFTEIESLSPLISFILYVIPVHLASFIKRLECLKVFSSALKLTCTTHEIKPFAFQIPTVTLYT